MQRPRRGGFSHLERCACAFGLQDPVDHVGDALRVEALFVGEGAFDAISPRVRGQAARAVCPLTFLTRRTLTPPLHQVNTRIGRKMNEAR